MNEIDEFVQFHEKRLKRRLTEPELASVVGVHIMAGHLSRNRIKMLMRLALESPMAYPPDDISN